MSLRPKPLSAAFRTFRTIWRHMIPGNFHRGDGELVQYTEGWFLDAFAETCRQTASLMFPSVCPEDALEKIGKDRAIPRGFAEPDASYRRRLIAWRFPRGHRIRGNAVGLLEQISAVFGGAVESQTIDVRGTRYTRATGDDGAITVERAVTWNWDGVALTPNWARFWVVIEPTAAAPLPTWDAVETASTTWDAAEDAATCWAGTNIHPGQLAAIKRLCQVGRLSWIPAGRRPITCVVIRTGEAYPAPDGTWDDWSSRPSATYAFFPLHPSIE
jgi:hypothetical protein